MKNKMGLPKMVKTEYIGFNWLYITYKSGLSWRCKPIFQLPVIHSFLYTLRPPKACKIQTLQTEAHKNL